MTNAQKVHLFNGLDQMDAYPDLKSGQIQEDAVTTTCEKLIGSRGLFCSVASSN